MKINWKVRLKNKEWLISFAGALIAFIYQILGLLGITAPISEDSLIQIIAVIINLAALTGIIIDPTTKGASDSERALGYTEPN